MYRLYVSPNSTLLFVRSKQRVSSPRTNNSLYIVFVEQLYIHCSVAVYALALVGKGQGLMLVSFAYGTALEHSVGRSGSSLRSAD